MGAVMKRKPKYRKKPFSKAKTKQQLEYLKMLFKQTKPKDLGKNNE